MQMQAPAPRRPSDGKRSALYSLPHFQQFPGLRIAGNTGIAVACKGKKTVQHTDTESAKTYHNGTINRHCKVHRFPEAIFRFQMVKHIRKSAIVTYIAGILPIPFSTILAATIPKLCTFRKQTRPPTTEKQVTNNCSFLSKHLQTLAMPLPYPAVGILSASQVLTLMHRKSAPDLQN